MAKSVILIVMGLAMFGGAFMLGVNLWGMLAMFGALIFAGYGAGLMMDTPCGQMKKN
jgi:hypothetical protein